MKTFFNISLNCCVLFVLFACSKDTLEGNTDNDNKVEVEISTTVETKSTVVTQFTDGDEMNLYAKTYGDIKAPDFVKNIKATYNGGSWDVSPVIYLGEDEKTFIYAVSPYSDTNTDPKAIIVDVSQQKDVLYSGSFVPVSYTTHTAKLTMKHALSLSSLNICTQGYNGTGKLQKLEVVGEEIYVDGTMDISTGKIAGNTKGNIVIESEKQLLESGWTEDLPKIWVIPFSTKAKNVNLKATIDGKDYVTSFPEVEMKSGFQYIFRLVLTNYGLEFIADQTVVISLNEDSDEMETLEKYGIISLVHSAKEFVLPMLSGDNVFGNVTWGDGVAESYSMEADHSYSVDGDKTIIIETWNSRGFELKDMVGIEEIDLSKY